MPTKTYSVDTILWAARIYSNNAVPTTLSSQLTAGVTTANVGDTTGWPSPGAGQVGVVAFDFGNPTLVEIATYTGKTGTTLTGLTRGLDGTSDVTHSAATKVRHVASAADIHDRSHDHSKEADDNVLIPQNLIVTGLGKTAFEFTDKTASTGITWGSDTNLYRSTVNTLKTDSHLLVSGGLQIDGAGINEKLYFGSALDTNLYRSAANTLKTDDKFIVGTGGGLEILDTTGIAFGADTNLYRFDTNILKTDDSLVVEGTLTVGGIQSGFRGVHAVRAANQSCGPSTPTIIDFNEADAYDTDAFHDHASGTLATRQRCIAPSGLDGYYMAFAATSCPAFSGILVLEILKNGVVVENTQEQHGGNSERNQVVTGPISLVATDYIEFRINQTSTGSINFSGNVLKLWRLWT